MEHSKVSMGIKQGMFLGSVDRIILAGNTPTANTQIQYSMFQNGQDGTKKFFAMADLKFNNYCCNAMELCGVPRLASTFAVFGLSDRNTGAGAATMLKLSTAHDHAELTSPTDDDGNDKNGLSAGRFIFDHKFSVTSLSFSPDLDMLAIGTESGDVAVLDVYSGRVVSKVKADACGINKVHFLKTGCLVTVGDSTKSQIKVWDLRSGSSSGVSTNSSNASPAMRLGLRQEFSDGYNSISLLDSPSRKRRPRFTCLTSHPVQQEKVISGTASGSVLLWDLRSEASVEFQPHSSLVTDVKMHPHRYDTVLSASSDGTVRCFDSADYTSATIHRPSTHALSPPGSPYQSRSMGLGPGMAAAGSGAGGDPATFPVLLADAGIVTSLDCESDSCTLLAVSDIGSMWRMTV